MIRSVAVCFVTLLAQSWQEQISIGASRHRPRKENWRGQSISSQQPARVGRHERKHVSASLKVAKTCKLLQKSATVVLSLALAFSSVGCVNRASTQLEEDMTAVRRERNPERLVEHGLSFKAVGDLTRAEQYLNAALELGADERKVFPVLLEICVQDRRYRSAVAYSEDYLKKHPAEHRLRFVLATFYSALGDTARAKLELERVVRAEPELADAHYTLAVLLRDDFSDYSGADEHFREYLRLSPTGEHREEAQSSLLSRIQ